MNVSDVMNAQVRTALATDSVSLAMRIMLGARVSGLPVVDDKGQLVGMITEGDLLRRAEVGTDHHRPRWLEIVLGPRRMAQEYVDTHSRRVGDLMTSDVVTIEESAPLGEAVALMEKHRIRRLPVTRQGKLAGILSRSDFMRAFLHALPETTAAETSDADISRRIDQEMLRCPWITRSAIKVGVAKGAVEIDGVVTNGAMRDALRVLVENVPGVTGVRDRLVVEEPARGYFK
ncbi:CBS domain-containing protein [Dyella sp. EPa41]|uniref:CBS domain-containing protein n=1 Tax=Dyella sp. EPa41 TaxID=1561194 RepID=UPI001915FA82|nr:CBS domain-containing protein [Dyella sp. EPa41]